MNYTENRPWGNFEVLSDKSNHKVKRITVKAGARLSLQSHKFRSEHWFIVSGSGIVTIADKQIPVKAGQAVDIPLQVKHRVENNSQQELILIEVQTGESFDESDIVRYQDDYNRV